MWCRRDPLLYNYFGVHFLHLKDFEPEFYEKTRALALVIAIYPFYPYFGPIYMGPIYDIWVLAYIDDGYLWQTTFIFYWDFREMYLLVMVILYGHNLSIFVYKMEYFLLWVLYIIN